MARFVVPVVYLTLPALLYFASPISVQIGVSAKVYDRCELARELSTRFFLNRDEVAHWVCIAQHSSNFDTAAYYGDHSGASHGLFQISDVYWCAKDGQELQTQQCNVSCDKLLDDNLVDDLRCIHIIYDMHLRFTGDGYSAWLAHKRHCSYAVDVYVADCFGDVPHLFAVAAPSTNAIGGALHLPHASKKWFKVYERCELAQELYFKHKLPIDQIATWVCIAQHESRFDTSAIGRLNADGSEDHGLFQISDLYWCSTDAYSGGKACSVPCDKLRDNDIADDVRCIRRIHAEHKGISGDGFTAWAVYRPYCQQQSFEHVTTCFGGKKPVQKYHHHQQQQQQYSHSHIQNSNKAQIYSQSHALNRNVLPITTPYGGNPFLQHDIATLVCIAQFESSFSTAAVGRLNNDGTEVYGLFQISDLYWCSHDLHGDKGCKLPCHKLLDADLVDDVKCVRTIHEEHTRLSGDGFTAWTVYERHCRHQHADLIAHCFADSKETTQAANLASPNGLTTIPHLTVLGDSKHVTSKLNKYSANPFLQNALGNFEAKNKFHSAEKTANYFPFPHNQPVVNSDNPAKRFHKNPYLLNAIELELQKTTQNNIDQNRKKAGTNTVILHSDSKILHSTQPSPTSLAVISEMHATTPLSLREEIMNTTTGPDRTQKPPVTLTTTMRSITITKTFPPPRRLTNDFKTTKTQLKATQETSQHSTTALRVVELPSRAPIQHNLTTKKTTAVVYPASQASLTRRSTTMSTTATLFILNSPLKSTLRPSTTPSLATSNAKTQRTYIPRPTESAFFFESSTIANVIKNPLAGVKKNLTLKWTPTIWANQNTKSYTRISTPSPKQHSTIPTLFENFHKRTSSIHLPKGTTQNRKSNTSTLTPIIRVSFPKQATTKQIRNSNANPKNNTTTVNWNAATFTSNHNKQPHPAPTPGKPTPIQKLSSTNQNPLTNGGKVNYKYATTTPNWRSYAYVRSTKSSTKLPLSTTTSPTTSALRKPPTTASTLRNPSSNNQKNDTTKSANVTFNATTKKSNTVAAPKTNTKSPNNQYKPNWHVKPSTNYTTIMSYDHEKYRKDPFNHPFFARVNELFERSRSRTPTTIIESALRTTILPQQNSHKHSR